MTTHNITEILAEDNGRFTPLQRLLKTAGNQKQWTTELREFIEAPLCYEVSCSDIKGRQAHLLCTSAGAATKLRFLMPELLPQLNTLQSFRNITECKIRVSNPSKSP